jgi:hypothetical protein
MISLQKGCGKLLVFCGKASGKAVKNFVLSVENNDKYKYLVEKRVTFPQGFHNNLLELLKHIQEIHLTTFSTFSTASVVLPKASQQGNLDC